MAAEFLCFFFHASEKKNSCPRISTDSPVPIYGLLILLIVSWVPARGIWLKKIADVQDEEGVGISSKGNIEDCVLHISELI